MRFPNKFMTPAIFLLIFHSLPLRAADRVACPFMLVKAEEMPELPCATILIEDFNKSSRPLINKCGGVIKAQLEITGADLQRKILIVLLDSVQASAFPMAVPAGATIKVIDQSFMDPYVQFIDGNLSANIEYTETPAIELTNLNVEVRFRNNNPTPIYVSGRVDHPVQPTNLTQLCTFQKVIGQYDSWSFNIPKKARSTEIFQLQNALTFETAK